MNKKFRLAPTLVSLVSVQITAGAATALSIMGRPMFDKLIKPSFQPPDIVFPIAWGIIYALTFFACALYFSAAPASKKRTEVLIMLCLCAVFHVLWVLAVFVLALPAVGEIIIFVYFVLLLLAFTRIKPVSPAAAWLLFPQLIWLTAAAVLGYALALLN